MIKQIHSVELDDLAPFFVKLGAASALTGDDRQAFFSACGPFRNIERGKEIVGAGNSSGQVGLVVSGWAASYVRLPNNSRQIVSFLLPGDIAGEARQPIDTVSNGTVAVTDVRVTVIDQYLLHALLSERPSLAYAVHQAKLVDAAVLRTWIVSLGRRTAYARLAHLICELHFRLEIAGLIEDGVFDWPLTQYDLADALGLTAVHTNRTLTAIRHAGLVQIIKGKRMMLINLKSLREAAGFDGRYLRTDGSPQLSISAKFC